MMGKQVWTQEGKYDYYPRYCSSYGFSKSADKLSKCRSPWSRWTSACKPARAQTQERYTPTDICDTVRWQHAETHGVADGPALALLLLLLTAQAGARDVVPVPVAEQAAAVELKPQKKKQLITTDISENTALAGSKTVKRIPVESTLLFWKPSCC